MAIITYWCEIVLSLLRCTGIEQQEGVVDMPFLLFALSLQNFMTTSWLIRLSSSR